MLKKKKGELKKAGSYSGEYCLIWPIWEYAAGQGMGFLPLCPKQGIKFHAMSPRAGILSFFLNSIRTLRVLSSAGYVF